MALPVIRITQLPTRFEPLWRTFGELTKMTFVPQEGDLGKIKTFLAAAESSGQGKMLLLRADSGTGKSTFVHSLEVFLADKIFSVTRLPLPRELEVQAIPAYVARLPKNDKFTVINFDGREAPHFDEAEYQTFLVALNGVLRSRSDIIVIWPITDMAFSAKIIALMNKVGGRSAFSGSGVYELNGLPKDKFLVALGKILQVANWKIEDAAITHKEVQSLIESSSNLGNFLDDLQLLISQRFDTGDMGITFPTLVICLTSSEEKLRETCRGLRRADSFYVEASRLSMYTKRSNAAEWWQNRSTSLKSALPHVIALFNAQLITVSASAVVHAVQQGGNTDLVPLITGLRADRGNAMRVMESTELVKFVKGEPLDNREYGSNVKEDTFTSYDRIQEKSETHHKEINKSIMDLVHKNGYALNNLQYEGTLVRGLQTDVTYDSDRGKVALEFHHKASAECTSNKIAIYLLEKIKEYAINYGLAER
jgi:hypothetical protein